MREVLLARGTLPSTSKFITNGDVTNGDKWGRTFFDKWGRDKWGRTFFVNIQLFLRNNAS